MKVATKALCGPLLEPSFLKKCDGLKGCFILFFLLFNVSSNLIGFFRKKKKLMEGGKYLQTGRFFIITTLMRLVESGPSLFANDTGIAHYKY